MKILVTGAAGFIGSFLVDRLVAEGHEVVGVDNLEPQVHGTGRPNYLNAGCHYVWGSYGDAELIRHALTDVEAVFHMGALVGVAQSMYEIARYTQGNALDTAVLLEEIVAMKERPRKIIVASSMSIYGEGAYKDASGQVVYADLRPLSQLKEKQWEVFDPHTKQPLEPIATPESKPLNPKSIYAIGKRDQEEMFHVIGQAYNIPSVACRFFNAYGSRQALSNPYTGVAAIFCSRLLKDLPPMIFEDAQQMRDFVHVSDLVEGLLLCLHSAAACFETFNLGSGTPISIKEVADVLSQTITGGRIEPLVSQEFRVGDVRHCFADNSKAMKLLDYSPRYTFHSGVPELVEWVSKQHAEKNKQDNFDYALGQAKQRGLVI